MPALEASHRGRPLREEIDDLTLALIAPLGADDDYEFTQGIYAPKSSISPKSPAARCSAHPAPRPLLGPSCASPVTRPILRLARYSAHPAPRPFGAVKR